MTAPVLYDASGNPIQLNRLRRNNGQVQQLLSGFKGANDGNGGPIGDLQSALGPLRVDRE